MTDTRLVTQRRGPILDVWAGPGPATCFCHHGISWPEGADFPTACEPCVREWQAKVRP